MNSFLRKTVDYKPKSIINDTIVEEYSDITTAIASKDLVKEESVKVADRLLEHLAVIEEYNKRIESLNYLISNTESLIKKELSYDTSDEDILDAIKSYGGNGNSVTFDMFKKAIEDILETYENMVITTLAGIES